MKIIHEPKKLEFSAEDLETVKRWIKGEIHRAEAERLTGRFGASGFTYFAARAIQQMYEEKHLTFVE